MKKDFSIIMSGLGFYRLSERRKKQILTVAGISLGIHLLALIIFGSWIVIRSLQEEETVFVAPPPVKTYKPRKLEHKVKVQKRQKSSSRPTLMPRLVSVKPAEFNLPEIVTDPQAIKTSFQPRFKAVTGVGMGLGMGTGYGLGGLGTGGSTYDLFGVRGRGERIAILVDVSVSMVEEIRGGSEGYEKVKRRLNKVLNALAEQTLFNVIVFANAASSMEPNMVAATSKKKEKAKNYIQPFNLEGQWGLSTGNLKASEIGLRSAGGTTRLDLALTAAFEQAADTVLIISDGLPMVLKLHSPDELADHQKRMDQWRAKNQGALDRYAAAEANAVYVEEKVWIPPTPASGPKEGSGGGQAAQPGRWETQRVPRKPLPPRPSPPELDKWWNLAEFIEHFRILHEELYNKKGRALPIAHAIGYGIDDDGSAFLKGFTRQYDGKYRRVGKRLKGPG